MLRAVTTDAEVQRPPRAVVMVPRLLTLAEIVLHDRVTDVDEIDATQGGLSVLRLVLGLPFLRVEFRHGPGGGVGTGLSGTDREISKRLAEPGFGDRIGRKRR